MRNWWPWRRRQRFSDVFPSSKETHHPNVEKRVIQRLWQGTGLMISCPSWGGLFYRDGGGDPATRQIANLVLLNSDFNDVPEILFEGRRVVNNIAHIAPIFLIKTIYSFLLAVICIASALLGRSEWILIFPFIPIQITMIDQFVEGFPPFVLTFERNIKPVEPNFLRRSMLRALPSALMVVFSVLFVKIFGTSQGWSELEISTLLYYLLGSIGFLSVFRACMPFTLWRVLLIVWSVGGFLATALFPESKNCLKFQPWQNKRCLFMVSWCWSLQWFSSWLVAIKLENKERLQSVDCSFLGTRLPAEMWYNKR